MKKSVILYSDLYKKGKLMLLTAVSLTAIVSCSKNDLQGTETKKEQAVSMASSTTISPNLLVQEDFEGTTYFPNSGTSVDKIRSYENCNPSADEPNGDIEHGTVYDWTLMRKTDHVFEGSKSGYFEIRKDQPLVGGSQRIRSEVVVISGKEDTRWTPDAWYSFAVLFPTDGMETDNDASETLNQWWEDGGNDNVLRIRSGKVFFEGTQPSGMALPLYDLFKTSASTSPVAIGTGTTSISNMVPIVKDKWVQFVFHFIHSFGSDGLTEIWRDGVKIYEIKGTNMHAGIPKWKIGLYKASYANSTRPYRRVYFDNVRVGKQGSTLADMMSGGTTTTNVPPTANAGSDVSIVLPVSSVTLAGKATDSDGTVSSTVWSQVSGATATLTNPNTLNATVSNLAEGSYVFRLTVTDDKGATTTDDVTVTVTKPANLAPVTNAGSDVTITLPTNTVQLAGNATDQDGSISKLSWTKTSGGNYTISNASIANPVVTLEAGTYVFRLTSTDNLGLSSYDEVSITVKSATTTGLSISSFTLIDAATEKDIMTITDGATISLKQLGTTKLNIRANPSATSSNVKFELTGTQSKTFTDKAAPYALMGDNGSGNYYYGNWNPPALGSYTLKATPVYGTTTGTAGTIHFTFVQ